MQNEFVLEMKQITKTYGNNTVLSDVSLSVKPGEIHALLGENGAGKSTLMNILFGMPVIHSTGGFGGEVYLDGEKVNITSPLDAMHKGIGMVHQEFMLLPGFNITENIKLNREISRPNLISRVMGKKLETLDTETMAFDARKALDSVGMGIDEYTMVNGLPVGYMQFVEIAREIDKTGMKLLVFDEPTAVLTESEANQLISVMKKIAESGIAIIFITHIYLKKIPDKEQALLFFYFVTGVFQIYFQVHFLKLFHKIFFLFHQVRHFVLFHTQAILQRYVYKPRLYHIFCHSRIW